MFCFALLERQQKRQDILILVVLTKKQNYFELRAHKKTKIMKNFKKEVVYTMPYRSESEIKKANDKRQKLYEKYNCVQVYPNGLYEVRIIASN